MWIRRATSALSRRRSVFLLLGAIALTGIVVAGYVVPEEPLSDDSLPTASLRVTERAPAAAETTAYEDLHARRRSGDRAQAIVIERGRAFMRKQLIVAFEPGTDVDARREVLERVSGRRIRPLDGNVELIEIASETRLDFARKRLARSPAVAYAEPNFVYRAVREPSDSFFSDQWSLENRDAVAQDRGGADIDATVAWDTITGGAETTVAVIDTGVAYDHPDLEENVWTNPAEATGEPGVDDDGNGYVDDIHGWDWVDDDPDPIDEQGHGTHVAGTIGAEGDNALGISGVTWDVSIMPLRVLDETGAGSVADIAEALSYAARIGADVANASLSGPGRSQTLESAITAASDVLFVVAAGNDGSNNELTASYPCNFAQRNVICVAATGRDDRLASYSNYGATSVDLAAPGSRIVSTVPAIDRVFNEGFADLSQWTTTGATGWAIASDAGGEYATDSPLGSYDPATATEITLRTPISLTAANRCSLAYALRVDTEPREDIVHVEVSSDGGWTALSRWSGSSSGRWVSIVDGIPLQGAVDLGIRFRLQPDGDATVGDGVGVDDVSVSCLSSDYDGTELAYYSGTSMATPHVAGAAALLVAAEPELSATYLGDLLMAGAEAVRELAGKTVAASRLDVGRSLAALAGQPVAPPPSPVELPTRPAGGGGVGGFGHSPSPESSPEAAPSTPGPTPSASPSEAPAEITQRDVSLVVRRHLRARGRIVLEESGDYRCRANVVVQISRNGRVVAKARIASEGTYRIRLPDRPGRYRARVGEVRFEDGSSCEASRSPMSRHAH